MKYALDETNTLWTQPSLMKKDAKMDTIETISKTDWEKTPKTVKKLVKQLVGTLNVVVIPEGP